jgi:Uma2 family endonuclease
MTTTAAKPITAAEFARMPGPEDGARQELVRGEIVTMPPPPPGFPHGRCQVRVVYLLESYCRSTQRGRVTVETGVVTESDPDTVRGPDVAFWSADRLPLQSVPQGYPEVPADLCVEVLTPNTNRASLQTKIEEYLRRGVRVVWVVDPEDRSVTVYRQPGEGRVLWANATLTEEEVLPGFQCRVAEFFE